MPSTSLQWRMRPFHFDVNRQRQAIRQCRLYLDLARSSFISPLERHFKKTAKSNNTLSQRLDYFQKALLLTTVTQLKTRTADKNH